MQVESERGNSAATRWLAALSELVAIVAIFAAAGAWPTPDTNEAHYLTRARHAADPTWAAGDFFLESPEAHGAFTWVMGPLTTAVTLDASAWIGRIAGWVLLAAGFLHTARAVLAPAVVRLLAALLFSLALRHTTAAGEWVIGGCEAKVFAWAGVLWAAGEIARDRWGGAWVALGAATAAHPIVGGWGMVACAAESFVFGRRIHAGWLAAGVALAAVGVVPALQSSLGADAATRAEAARIYVAERLSHHLLPRTFADGMIARHLLAVLAWWLLSRQVAASPTRARVDGFTLGALAISLAGCLISLAEPFAPRMTYGLLRFYWFRLADGLVPLTLSIAAAAWLHDADAVRRVFGRPSLVRWLVVALLACDLVHESRHWPLPGRTRLVARSDRFMNAASWRGICDWVRDNVPDDACFIVPRMAGSFVWRTGRREVVCWKNMPQGPQSLVDWRRRIVDCYSRDGSFAVLESQASALGTARLAAAAGRYGVDHVIVPAGEPVLDDPRFTRLYANDGYAVYRIQR